MIDYEVLKTVDGYRTFINGDLHIVPDKYRHMNSHKLQKLYVNGELKAVPKPVVPAA
jgi:hypothetical protein